MNKGIHPPLVKTSVGHLLTYTSTEQALDSHLLVLLHGVLVGSLVVEGVEDLVTGGAGGRDVVHVPHVPCHGLPQARNNIKKINQSLQQDQEWVLVWCLPLKVARAYKSIDL